MLLYPLRERPWSKLSTLFCFLFHQRQFNSNCFGCFYQWVPSRKNTSMFYSFPRTCTGVGVERKQSAKIAQHIEHSLQSVLGRAVADWVLFIALSNAISFDVKWARDFFSLILLASSADPYCKGGTYIHYVRPINTHTYVHTLYILIHTCLYCKNAPSSCVSEEKSMP